MESLTTSKTTQITVSSFSSNLYSRLVCGIHTIAPEQEVGVIIIIPLGLLLWALIIIIFWYIGIPTLVILNKSDGKMITDKGRGAVLEDAEGEVGSI